MVWFDLVWSGLSWSFLVCRHFQTINSGLYIDLATFLQPCGYYPGASYTQECIFSAWWLVAGTALLEHIHLMVAILSASMSEGCHSRY